MQKLERKKIKIAIASNSTRATVSTAIENLQLGKFIEFYLSNQDVSKGKPDPEIYNKAIKMLNLKPTECLIVEDNYNGIKAALDSGANLLKVTSVDEVNHTNIMKKIDELNKSL
jgi:HAD superfamily hydrolase (TIGR01509 family)